MASAEDEISASIERTLLEQSRKTELKIAWVRVAALALTTAVNLAAYLSPPEIGETPTPITNFLLVGACTVGAGGIVFMLGRYYRPWLRTALPFADALMVVLLFATTTQRFDGPYLLESGVLVNIAATTALLAATGGLRLSRASALLTTALAALIFGTVCVIAGFGPLRLAFPMSLLLGVGLLGMWMTDIVRASIRSEVARSILERFVPSSVVDEAHRDPLTLITQPRSLDATVVVTDLRGFTSLSEREPPPVVLRFLNDVQGTLADVVMRHGGTIDKFMGDGMLAVFGAPEPQADHAARAIRAAEEMVTAVEAIDRKSEARVRLGVGVHSGEIVAGCLGSGTKLEFTVIGDAVNATSRLEAMTKEKAVSALISDETVRRARGGEGLPDLQPVGPVTLRGREQPLLVYRLASEGRSAESMWPDSLR